MDLFLIIFSIINAASSGLVLTGFFSFLMPTIFDNDIFLIIFASLLYFIVGLIISYIDKGNMMIARFVRFDMEIEHSFLTRLLIATLLLYKTIARALGFLVAGILFVLRLCLTFVFFIGSGGKINRLADSFILSGLIVGVYHFITSIIDKVVDWIIRGEVFLFRIHINK